VTRLSSITPDLAIASAFAGGVPWQLPLLAIWRFVCPRG